MIGYLDLKDVFSEIFQDHNCVCEADITKLKGKKLGISFYEIINDLIVDVIKHNSWDNGLIEIRKKFDFYDIETLFVMPGLNISMGTNMQDAFWRIKHEWWKIELFKNLYETSRSNQADKFISSLSDIAEKYFFD